MKYILYIDMDGVLCNFLKSAGLATGRKFSTHMDWEKVKHTDWKILAGLGAGFWANIKWMDDGKELWDFVKQYNPNILSAFPKAEGNKQHAIAGKEQWIDKYLTGFNEVYLVKGQEKQNFANKDSILVDDSPRNIEQFITQGGIGILHKNAKDTIRQLKIILKWQTL